MSRRSVSFRILTTALLLGGAAAAAQDLAAGLSHCWSFDDATCSGGAYVDLAGRLTLQREASSAASARRSPATGSTAGTACRSRRT